MHLCHYFYFVLDMLDKNQKRKLRTVTAGILVLSFISTQPWVFETLEYDFNSDFLGRNRPIVEVFSQNTECLSAQTMHSLLSDLSTLSVQLSIHEERDGIIISDPIQGLIDELHLVYGDDICTEFSDLSQQQQRLYIEIEKLVFDLKGLGIKAKNTQEEIKQTPSTLI